MNRDIPYFVAHINLFCAILMKFMEISVSQGRSSSAKSFDQERSGVAPPLLQAANITGASKRRKKRSAAGN